MSESDAPAVSRHEDSMIAPDPEPDLPEGECTTAVMLQKVASHLENGNLVARNGLDAHEWITSLRDRATRLEQRPIPAAVPARLQDVPQYIPCLNGSPDGHRWDRCAICGTGRNGTIEPASDLRAGLIGPVVYGWHANGMIAALNEWISTPGYVRLEDFAALQRDLAIARTLADLRLDINNRLTKQHNEWKARAEAAEARLATVTQALYEATHGMERSAPGADMAGTDRAGTDEVSAARYLAVLDERDTLHRRAEAAENQWQNAEAKIARQNAANQERAALAAARVLELAAQVSFVCATDTPDTLRAARAALVSRVHALEQERIGYQQEADRLFLERAALLGDLAAVRARVVALQAIIQDLIDNDVLVDCPELHV